MTKRPVTKFDNPLPSSDSMVMEISGSQKAAGILESRETHPTPKVLTLSAPLRYVEFSFIPTEKSRSDGGNQMWAGLDADLWGPDALTETLGALVTYRAAGQEVTFVMDWLAGSYQLPPCEKVSVKAVCRLSTARKVTAAVVDGMFPGARTPTITGATNATAAVPVSVGAPACSKSMEVWGNLPSNVLVASAGSWSPSMRRDTTAFVYSPPWSPVDFDDRARSDLQFTITSDVTQKLCCRFYLGL